MKSFQRTVAALSCLVLSSCVGGAVDLTIPSSVETSSGIDPATISAKVLFVGNSFTYYNDMPKIAEALGRNLGMDLTVDSVTKGSQKLIDTAKSTDELGAQFDEAMKTQYTHIVLQEHSTTPINAYSTFLSGVQAIMAKINEKQRNAQIYLYATWGFSSMLRNGETIPEGEARIREAYHTCAASTGLKVNEVGSAFSEVYKNHSDINLYHTDEKHPSYAGSYLSAATHLVSIFGVDVTRAAYDGSLTAEVAATLRTVAYGAAHGLYA